MEYTIEELKELVCRRLNTKHNNQEQYNALNMFYLAVDAIDLMLKEEQERKKE